MVSALSRSTLASTAVLVSMILIGCGPRSGPDKTIGGAVLGAGWGAGAGALVGHQVSHAGEGALVGAGVGMVGGALQGAGYDAIEETQIDHEEQLASLRIQNMANNRQLAQMQRQLDDAITNPGARSIYSVYFDSDASNLRAGAVSNLEVIAESIRVDPSALKVFVVGHADDSGNPEYNQRMAEARARTVAAYLGQRGISMGQIVIETKGSTQPIASNATPEGRQLNRRVDVFIGK